MASTINALTSGGGGLTMVGDATGNLDIQSGGSTVVAVTSTGATVTGTLAATGASTFTGTGKFATTIGVGNATPAASGAGITFPATQSASSDANTLDDYEEGTFSPTVIGYTTAGTATYARQQAFYTKIGRQVFFNLDIVYSAGTGAGDVGLAGLPFATGSATMLKNFDSITDGITLTAGYYLIGSLIGTSTTTFYLYQSILGSGNFNSIPYDAAGQIVVSGSYFI